MVWPVYHISKLGVLGFESRLSGYKLDSINLSADLD